MKFIEKNFHKYLFNVVKNQASNNKTAKVIATYYKSLNQSSKEKLFESLLSYHNTFLENHFEEINFPANTKDAKPGEKDFRLKSLRIESCRRFPKLADKIKYGIDFELDNTVKNHIFLGHNGSGKSSIFCALEYLYTQSIGEKKLRTGDIKTNSDGAYKKYLGHFDHFPFCNINTVNGEFSITKTLPQTYSDFQSSLPENHFISDFNLYEKGKIDCLGNSNEEFSFHRLIASNLGLQEYLDFTALLKSIATYRRSKESIERRKLIDEKNNLEESIRTRSSEIKEKLIKKAELQNGLQDNSELENQKVVKRIFQLKESNYKLNVDSDKFKTAIKNVELAYSKYHALSILPDLQNEASFLSLGLQILDTSEGCPFCQSSTLTIEEIRAKITKRIESIKDYQEAQEKLNSSVKIFLEHLFSVRDSLDVFANKLSDEIDVNKMFIQLNSITAKEREKLTSLKYLNSNINETISLLSLSRNGDVQDVVRNILFSEEIFEKYVDSANELANSIQNERLLVFGELENATKKLTAFDSPSQKIAVIDSEIKYAESIIPSNQRRIGELNKEIDKLSKTIDLISIIKSEAESFGNLLESNVNELTAGAFDVIKDTVTNVLQDYLEDDGAFLNIYIKEEVNKNDVDLKDRTIVAEIQKIEDGILKTIPPSIYFNTFRYRLLCLMVCISIVIVVRQQTKVNLPLVMDDIFNSSDYTSKSTFRIFLSKLFNIFKKFNGDMPLQLILFTHDELIFDCAIDAVADFKIESPEINEITDSYWLQDLRSRTVFARLFAPKDIDEEITESGYGNYRDVTYKIPALIQTQILNEE
jgi:hypothetical protein